ncbi:hypothetical protein TNIN_120091 [Trichonephila inaurata madagascariensis]|uniref:Uncharacterized protein n=1 Tax=Trichonephila inaurata madagascariensis TaxID=2747483 RepID=A0A8X7C706_9ARAC|nr:hypothetical protein TNIN_120091 [Trichonephila inaurata madagascariensis]
MIEARILGVKLRTFQETHPLQMRLIFFRWFDRSLCSTTVRRNTHPSLGITWGFDLRISRGMRGSRGKAPPCPIPGKGGVGGPQGRGKENRPIRRCELERPIEGEELGRR